MKREIDSPSNFEDETRKRVEVSPLSFFIRRISSGNVIASSNELPKEMVCRLRERRTNHSPYANDSIDFQGSGY